MKSVILPHWSQWDRAGFRPTAQICATGCRPFLMSCFFTEQVLAQLDLLKRWKETAACKTDVYLLLKQLHEKVAAM